MIIIKPVSVMNKCFLDQSIEYFDEINTFEGLKCEECAFQLLYTSDNPEDYPRKVLYLSIKSGINDYISVRSVENVAVRYPSNVPDDDFYERKAKGLYPDVLLPLDNDNQVMVTFGELKALFVSVKLPEEYQRGVYPIRIVLSDENHDISAETVVNFCLINAVLPEQKTKVTNWIHYDCIANYYNVEVFSSLHWLCSEKFIKCAVKNGINTILTPAFTPPLDTAIGHERLTVQLVDVYETDSGWRFKFDRFEKFINLCLNCGVKFFEISHLYTQWGASHAPKIMGYDKKNVYRCLFGWQTDALSEEYKFFLRSFLKAFKTEIKNLGIENRCIFHISDEPGGSSIDTYIKAKNQISDLLEEFTVIDALSDFEMYKSGAVKNPVPNIGDIKPFLQENIKDLWCYYCCGSEVGVTNRFIAMPMERTRMLGVQMFKYNISGFLHWGFNFYNSCGSVRALNPYLVNDGDWWVPAGDCFVVYPGSDGEPIESLRLKAFCFALQDIRVFELASSIFSKDEILKAIENDCPVSFFENNKVNHLSVNARKIINDMIKLALG
ncbi:MAG: DUF4091 domain-containing protein [Clostridiales bacterium]|nr:DUF4091 domain-containing protein [Clostridiales bacterium]